MDLLDATKILLSRIQKLEPEIATKIIGFLLIEHHEERDMIRLACAPEKLLVNVVHKTKLQLGYLSKPQVSTFLSSPISINPQPVSDGSLNYMSFSSNGPHSFSPQSSFRISGSPYWDPQLTSEHQSELFPSEFGDDYRFPNQNQLIGFEDQFGRDYYGPNGPLGNLNVQVSRRSSEFPVKICHYFKKGFCKHGSNCQYYHGTTDNFTPGFVGLGEVGPEDHVFSPGSLEKLEIEISELLKSRRGNPVSIASLPMLYYEKYGRILQAEGYLTESQRHGRTGYSLTKLLARLKSIRLIDRTGEAKSCYSAILRRPHGQHSVILAEDASKYNLDNRSERNDPGPIVSGSRQIYLTFPAESTFTEEDVSNYFSSFGAVEDVRIPCQQERMFGFVTFGNANTVKTILGKGNPHFVCGSRVLVKPYREKSKLVDRKNMEKNDHMHYGGNYSDKELDFPSRRSEPPRFLRRQLMEQEQAQAQAAQAQAAQAQALEMERRRLSELQLGYKHLHNQHHTDYYAVEDLNPSEEHLQYVLGVINDNYSVSDEKEKHTSAKYSSDQDRPQGINIPESHFAAAAAIGSSTSTVF